MKLIRKILLATDFLDDSDNILKNVIGLAKTFDPEIILIHVWSDRLNDEKAQRLLLEAANKGLNEIKARLEQEGIKVAPPLLVPGIHFEKIVETAEQVDANLIMIGAGVKDLNDTSSLGTTAEKIIRKSNRPVLVIKQDQSFKLNTILCPVDLSPTSGRALKTALITARRFHARLVVLNVFEHTPRNKKNIPHLLDAYEDYWANQYLTTKTTQERQFKAFLSEFNFKGVDLLTEIIEGKPAPEILAAISKHRVNLLIIGTSGRTGLSKFMLGSVAEKVIRKVPCSFVTTKNKDLFRLELEKRILDIENHFENAVQLVKDGFLEEAIQEFKFCLQINDMHVPSLKGLAGIYQKLDQPHLVKFYRRLVTDVLDRAWNHKIETELRENIN